MRPLQCLKNQEVTRFLGYLGARHASIQRYCKPQRSKESKLGVEKQRKDKEEEESAQLRDLESPGGFAKQHLRDARGRAAAAPQMPVISR